MDNNKLDISLIVCSANDFNKLKIENEKLIIRLSELTKDKEILQNIILNKDKTIEELKNENRILSERINELENNVHILKIENIKLSEDIAILKNKNKKFDALVKLNECNSIVNKNFKKEYRKWFNLKRFDYVPNINELIYNQPDENDENEIFKFWEDFLKKYPKSDDINFRNIYYSISNDRANNGAHANVSRMTKDEFDRLIKIAYPDEYENDKELYDNYRDWLFTFPLLS